MTVREAFWRPLHHHHNTLELDLP